MEVKEWPIGKVKPYDKNPRNNDDAVEATANSIREFGWQQPIVVDKNGVIIVGHTRLKAAKKLRLEQVPVTVAENLTDEQVKAYRLADNKTGELADWDVDMLGNELNDILNIDMEDFGFIDPIEDVEPIDDDEMDTTDITTHVLSIDKIKVELTDDEYNDLTKRLDQYIDENGVSFGFVRGLLHDS